MQNRNSGAGVASWQSPGHYEHNTGAGSYYAAAASPLHPDTLMPMKENEIESARMSMEHKRQPQDAEPWHLGIVLGGQGKVQRVVDGTPAHKAKLVFESQVHACPFIQGSFKA